MKKITSVLITRIAAKTVRDNATGCLIWTASKNRPNGYGQMWDGERLTQSHRIVWEIANGAIPQGVFVDHLCHVRLCCEISHLRLVADAINKQNRAGAQANCQTGIRGVYQVASGKYKARVQVGGKQFSPAPFDSIEEAERAVIEMRARLHEPVPEIQ